jgi:hypothetical protein
MPAIDNVDFANNTIDNLMRCNNDGEYANSVLMYKKCFVQIVDCNTNRKHLLVSPYGTCVTCFRRHIILYNVIFADNGNAICPECLVDTVVPASTPVEIINVLRAILATRITRAYAGESRVSAIVTTPDHYQR